MSNDFERVLDTLVDGGVLVEEEAGLHITEAFLEYTSMEPVPSDATELREATDGSLDDAEASSLAAVAELSPAAVATYLGVAEFCSDDLSVEERAWVTMTLDCIPPNEVPEGHTPELFTPIDANHVPFVEHFFRKAIVFIWREDCRPCEAVQNDFDALLEEAPPDTALFSVFGPDAGRLLREEYDVSGGPTTLFFLDGRVDLRLIGAQYPSVLETELEKFEDM